MSTPPFKLPLIQFSTCPDLLREEGVANYGFLFSNKEQAAYAMEAINNFEEMKRALEKAYEENQNIHCSTTISPKIGWEALERQTKILRETLSRLQEKKG